MLLKIMARGKVGRGAMLELSNEGSGLLPVILSLCVACLNLLMKQRKLSYCP